MNYSFPHDIKLKSGKHITLEKNSFSEKGLFGGFNISYSDITSLSIYQIHNLGYKGSISLNENHLKIVSHNKTIDFNLDDFEPNDLSALIDVISSGNTNIKLDKALENAKMGKFSPNDIIQIIDK